MVVPFASCQSVMLVMFDFNVLYREASHYIYVHENPQLDSHIFPRGSICSVRKGSYDLKSLSSDGMCVYFQILG